MFCFQSSTSDSHEAQNIGALGVSKALSLQEHLLLYRVEEGNEAAAVEEGTGSSGGPGRTEEVLDRAGDVTLR